MDQSEPEPQKLLGLTYQKAGPLLKQSDTLTGSSATVLFCSVMFTTNANPSRPRLFCPKLPSFNLLSEQSSAKQHDRANKRVRRAFTLIALGCMLALMLFSCRVNTRVLQEQLISELRGAELMFYQEYLQENLVGEKLNQVAREAVRHGFERVTAFLQQQGANLNELDSDGWNPILIAAWRGNISMVRFLIEVAGVDVRAKNSHRETALMLAARTGSIELCNYLIDRGSNVNAKSLRGLTALMYAASSGHEDLVRSLIERGADAHVVDSVGKTVVDYLDSPSLLRYFDALGVKPGDDGSTEQKP